MNMSFQKAPQAGAGGAAFKTVLAWLAVGTPLVWGMAQTIANAAQLFH